MRRPTITKYCKMDEPRDVRERELERKFEQFVEKKVDEFLNKMTEDPSKVIIIKDR